MGPRAAVVHLEPSVSFIAESRQSGGSIDRLFSASCGHPTVRLETGGDDTNQRRHLRRLLRYAAVGVSSRRVFCRESATRQQLPRLLRSQQNSRQRRKWHFSTFIIIPAKAGIQLFQRLLGRGSALRSRDDGLCSQGHFSAACNARSQRVARRPQ